MAFGFRMNICNDNKIRLDILLLLCENINNMICMINLRINCLV